jgi:alkane 1-monooxygenase
VPISILLALLFAHSFRTQNSVVETGSEAFRLLPILYIPFQLAAIGWAAHEVAIRTASPVAFASLAVSVGVCTGVFGVLAAHEMVHSRLRWHQWLGALLLTGMSYRHFGVAHVYGHHRFAATERDASTARLGESFYRFLVRTVPAQALEAWRFEQHRCRGQSLALLHNRIVQDVALMIAVYAAVMALVGWHDGPAGPCR